MSLSEYLIIREEVCALQEHSREVRQRSREACRRARDLLKRIEADNRVHHGPAMGGAHLPGLARAGRR